MVSTVRWSCIGRVPCGVDGKLRRLRDVERPEPNGDRRRGAPYVAVRWAKEPISQCATALNWGRPLLPTPVTLKPRSSRMRGTCSPQRVRCCGGGPEPQALLRRQCASKSARPIHQLSVREVIALQGAREDLMEGALDERKMVAQLGRLVFLPVLANPKALDFRFESRPWNPEFGSRA